MKDGKCSNHTNRYYLSLRSPWPRNQQSNQVQMWTGIQAQVVCALR